MTQYSIEQSSEKINHPKTKEYFREVFQSYVSGSYRSAVVMLYSVVICDLIYKLKELKDSFDDPTAISILENVETKKISNPESGDWEVLLLKEIEDRTYLLEAIDKTNVYYLRNQRHLSAHPVLSKEDLLTSPNRETVRALMRNMLDGILTKSAVMTTKVFTTILEDLAQHQNFFLEESSLEKYLVSKYFKNTNEYLIKNLFKDFWSISLKCQSEECRLNRVINYKTLKILYRRNKTELMSFIRDNSSHFSKIELNDTATLERTFAMLGHYPEIYELLEEQCKLKLIAKNEMDWRLKIKGAFLKESMEVHFTYLRDNLFLQEYGEYYTAEYKIEANEEILLYQWAEEYDCMEIYYDILIKYYIHSKSFNEAVFYFDKYINPYIKDFTEEQMLTLLKGIENNRQCRGHNLSEIHNSGIKTFSDRLLTGDFDYRHEFPSVNFLVEVR
ncbi:MAG TPA: hypothetical protein K8V56_06620 [Sporosarcina psychrophila]|uniref:Uncharacterized protein n=1 Tax=Sporosarcina psychrophila TaxID=1476 RepID=A0A921FXJ3_SPOPS|nr:hypothetical protein [Sporosarcina psychrophila]